MLFIYVCVYLSLYIYIYIHTRIIMFRGAGVGPLRTLFRTQRSASGAGRLPDVRREPRRLHRVPGLDM